MSVGPTASLASHMGRALPCFSLSSPLSLSLIYAHQNPPTPNDMHNTIKLIISKLIVIQRKMNLRAEKIFLKPKFLQFFYFDPRKIWVRIIYPKIWVWNSNRPNIIQTNSAQVEDLRDSFNIYVNANQTAWILYAVTQNLMQTVAKPHWTRRHTSEFWKSSIKLCIIELLSISKKKYLPLDNIKPELVNSQRSVTHK